MSGTRKRGPRLRGLRATVLGATALASLLACAPTDATPPPTPPSENDYAAHGEPRAFTMRVRGIDGVETLETHDAHGTYCDHCGGGPELHFCGSFLSPEGESVHLSVTLETSCFPSTAQHGWGFSQHASLSRGDRPRDTTERVERGRVSMQCSTKDERLHARFRLRFPSGWVHGEAWGEIDVSAGYD